MTKDQLYEELIKAQKEIIRLQKEIDRLKAPIIIPQIYPQPITVPFVQPFYNPFEITCTDGTSTAIAIDPKLITNT